VGAVKTPSVLPMAMKKENHRGGGEASLTVKWERKKKGEKKTIQIGDDHWEVLGGKVPGGGSRDHTKEDTKPKKKAENFFQHQKRY